MLSLCVSLSTLPHSHTRTSHLFTSSPPLLYHPPPPSPLKRKNHLLSLYYLFRKEKKISNCYTHTYTSLLLVLPACCQELLQIISRVAVLLKELNSFIRTLPSSIFIVYIYLSYIFLLPSFSLITLKPSTNPPQQSAAKHKET